MVIVEVTEYKNGRVRISLDGGISFLLYKKEFASLNLKQDQELSEEQWLTIRQEILVKRARKRAMYLLMKKDYTEKQLREKLTGNEYPEDVAEDAIQYVKGFRYIDDERYAANYVHIHQQNKSQRQLKMELSQRGVSKDQIHQALEEELEVSEEDVIRAYMRKKQYDPQSADESQKRRMYQFLLRKGFRTSDIMRCMKLNEFA